MVGICNIHMGCSDGPLDKVCLSDRLEDAGEGASKFQGLLGDFPDRGLIHYWHPLFKLCVQVQDEQRPSVLLGDRRNMG